MPCYFKRIMIHVAVCAGVIASTAVLGPSAASADKLDPALAPKRGQYVYDSYGRDARAAVTGNCVDTGWWSPQEATPECDPSLFASPNLPGSTRHAEASPHQQAAASSQQAQAAARPQAQAAAQPQAQMAASPIQAAPPQSVAAGTTAATTAAAAASTAAGHRAEAQPQAEAQSPGEPNGVRGPVASYTEEPQARVPNQAAVASGNRNGLGQEQGPNARTTRSEVSGSATGEAPSRQASAALGSTSAAAATAAGQSGAGAAQEQAQPPGNSGNSAQEAAGGSESSKQQVAVAPESGSDSNTVETTGPVAILPVTITVEADPLFDFDRSAVRTDSQTKLEQLVRQLKGIKYGDIVAVGYADPIGTAVYNQELSKHRAAAVKAYLTRLGIAADKIEIEGHGETEEFASYKGCGGLRTEKAIECLQPDRRVEVTVNARERN